MYSRLCHIVLSTNCVLIFLNFSDVSGIFFVFAVVLLFLYIRCNGTVSARMSLVCLAHKLYNCTVSSVFVLTLFEQIK